MKILRFLLFLLLPLTTFGAEDKCDGVVEVASNQASMKSFLIEKTGSSDWRDIYLIVGASSKPWGVKPKQQLRIAKEINKYDFSGYEMNAPLMIGDFYYAQCKYPKRKLRIRSLEKVDVAELASCWDPAKHDENNESRKCVEKLVLKP